jgi:hypothetical protein
VYSTVQAGQALTRFLLGLGRLCRIYCCIGNPDPPQAATTVLGGGREHSGGFHHRRVPTPLSQTCPIYCHSRGSGLNARTESFSGSYPGWRYQTRGRCACPCGRFGRRYCHDSTRAFLRSVSSPLSRAHHGSHSLLTSQANYHCYGIYDGQARLASIPPGWRDPRCKLQERKFCGGHECRDGREGGRLDC